ncbi:MAG: hypothetical protein GC171_06000 [Terrimonas sp.]|nr:hypothetical protein [Terrimonas sp.]
MNLDRFNALLSDSIEIEFIRFDYDVEKAAKVVDDSPLSNEYGDMLRKGYGSPFNDYIIDA